MNKNYLLYYYYYKYCIMVKLRYVDVTLSGLFSLKNYNIIAINIIITYSHQQLLFLNNCYVIFVKT